MEWHNILMLVPGSPSLSALLWAVIGVALLYFARLPVHQAILAASHVLHNAMRIAAISVLRAEQRLTQRNREVLLAAGREASERMVEREFERVNTTLKRDMGEYPSLRRKMTELIDKIDEDYQSSADVPPEPPKWVEAVKAVAAIPSQGDSMVATVLQDIHGSMEKAQERANDEYRSSSRMRHALLKKMAPAWRDLSQLVERADKNVDKVLERSATIDHHLEEYEQIMKETDRAERTLSSSSFTQFFIAGLVLAIAIGGAMINFNLIARPMQEMVGGSNYILGYKVANIAALVIILVEITMGLFLMESLRITRLFPVVGALDDKIRIRMVWISFGLLLTLASIEAGLAYMREMLSQDDAALVASLVQNPAATSVTNPHLWITTAAQMVMGFILPFALTFVALPLESFVHSSRTVLGLLGTVLLRTLASVLRLLGNIFRHSGAMLIHLYDVLIFGPLWVERMLQQRNGHKGEADKALEPAGLKETDR